MSKNLYSVTNSGFYSKFMNMVEQNIPSTLDPDCLGIDKIRRYRNNMKEKYYLSGDTGFFEHSKKLEFDKVFKDEYFTSDYLYQLIINFSEKRNLVKFKISNHEHMIELRIYQIDHVVRENRLCLLCKSKQIEDENHFLFQRQEHSSPRKVFLHQITEIVPDIERKPTEMT